MKLIPDSVCNTVLSRISLRNWTCGANSEPNAAVAIRQPPPSLFFISIFFISISSPVLSPIENIKSFLLADDSVAKRYRPSIFLPDADVKNHPFSCRLPRCSSFSITAELTLLTCKPS